MTDKFDCCPKCGSADSIRFERWEKFECTISFGSGDEYGQPTSDVKEPKTGFCIDCGHRISLNKVRA